MYKLYIKEVFSGETGKGWRKKDPRKGVIPGKEPASAWCCRVFCSILYTLWFLQPQGKEAKLFSSHKSQPLAYPK